jgi:hypothetical protein
VVMSAPACRVKLSLASNSIWPPFAEVMVTPDLTSRLSNAVPVVIVVAAA